MRLIDADALIDRIESDKKQDNISPGKFFLFKAYIMNAPTIEPDSDTISRSQAIKDVSEWATDILHPDRLVKEDAIYILESLPSAKQVTGKLNNPDDSLLTADSEACKEQKSKLDLISRQDEVNEIHKYFVEEIDKTPTKTDEDGDEVYTDMPTVRSLLACNKELSKRIKALPSAESTGAMDEAIQEYIKDGYMQPIGEDLISRQAAIEAVWKLDKDANEYVVDDTKEIHGYCTAIGVCVGELSALPSAPDSRQRGEWVTTAADSHLFTDKFQEDIRENIFGGADMRKGGEDE